MRKKDRKLIKSFFMTLRKSYKKQYKIILKDFRKTKGFMKYIKMAIQTAVLIGVEQSNRIMKIHQYSNGGIINNPTIADHGYLKDHNILTGEALIRNDDYNSLVAMAKSNTIMPITITVNDENTKELLKELEK